MLVVLLSAGSLLRAKFSELHSSSLKRKGEELSLRYMLRVVGNQRGTIYL